LFLFKKFIRFNGQYELVEAGVFLNDCYHIKHFLLYLDYYEA